MGALRRSMVMRPSVALSMVALEPIEDMRDYRDDDLSGRRLFVTGLPSSIDDVRLYLAFEGFGRITEAHVVKPGLGFVVFDDIPTADDALLGMEGSEISGKEIKVPHSVLHLNLVSYQHLITPLRDSVVIYMHT
jgi:RNA recognition motif-containing protein